MENILKCPEIYFIEDINHAIIIFPDGSIFNCNPRDYPLPTIKKMTDCLINEQVEPTDKEYEDYWNNAISDDIIENDQNCLLWCGYYLDWYLHKKSNCFPCSLYDLECWCKKV